MAGFNPHAELSRGIRELRLSGDYSDFTINCHGDKHKVHRMIICPRSKYFEKACGFGRENEDKEINLNGDEYEPEIIKLMIQYLYELDYETPGATERATPGLRYQSEPPVSNANLQWRRYFAKGLAGLNKSAMAEAMKVFHKYNPKTEIKPKVYVLRSNPPLNAPASPFGVPASPFGVPASAFGAPVSAFGASVSPFGQAFVNTSPQQRLEEELAAIVDREGTSGGVPWRPLSLQQAPVIHAKMYAIAEHFDIPRLKDLAMDKFLAWTEDHYTNPGFYDAIDVVFDEERTLEEDGALRDVVAGLVCEDLQVWGLDSRIEEKLREVPGLAFRVLKKHFDGSGCDR